MAELSRIDQNPREKHLIKHHRFSFGDCLVAVTERSNGAALYPVLFFLHGRFGHGEIWWPVVDRLFPRFKCFSVDLPGFGESFSAHERGLSLLEHAHLVGRIVDRFLSEHERAVLIGHDVGGAIAQICALELKEKLSGVVLINCAAIGDPVRKIETGWFGWPARWRLRKLLRASRSSSHAEQERSLLSRAWRENTTRSALIRAIQAFEISWPGPFERQIWREELRALRIPTLLLWGRRDFMNDPEVGLRLVRDLPDAHFFESEESGHWPNLDDPDWVSTKILEFAFRLAGPSSAFPRAIDKFAG